MNGDRLSGISTAWTHLFDAHGDRSDAARSAQAAIIDRYSAAAYRYLLKILGNPDAAEEVLQQFALELVQGGFRHATPERGRFRDYLKVSLARLAYRYRKRQAKNVQGLRDEPIEAPQGVSSVELLEEAFVQSCRDEALSRAWQRLRHDSGRSGPMLFAVLQYRSRHPEVPSQQMALELSKTLHRDPPWTPAGVRKVLQRAREQFADHLLDEVAETLTDASRESLEEEIISLGLHAYCKSAFKRRFGRE